KLDSLRAVWLKLERYAAAVRAATVGIAAIPGISERGVDELDQYTDIVEDLASRLSERVDWASVVVQDYKAALAHWQGEQISRLTVVSVIFLPITFLTGFFGMNFGWMARPDAPPLARAGRQAAPLTDTCFQPGDAACTFSPPEHSTASPTMTAPTMHTVP